MSQQRALELLRQAAAALESQPQSSTMSGSTTSATSTTPSSTTITSAVRSLFQPYNRTGIRSNIARRTPSVGPVRSFWTHKFCVLAHASDVIIPTREEKEKLYRANLGEKKLTFERNDDPSYFKSHLEESYPKLCGIGGFELLRSIGRSRSELDVIKMPTHGYSVKFLADSSILGQALCYIRPIQTDLPLCEEEEIAEDDCVEEECFRCHKLVPLRGLRQHCLECDPTNKICSGETDDDEQIEVKKKRLSVEQPICGYAYRSRRTLDDNKENAEDLEICPVCLKSFPSHFLSAHASSCGEDDGIAGFFGDHDSNSLDEVLETTYNAFTSKWEISVIRRNFLKTAMEQLQDSIGEDWTKKIKVRFIGEEGIDEGGLSREFFTMLFRESPVFEDSLFSVDADLLSKQHYLLMGKITAMAMLSGHPGPRNLEPHLVDFIISEKVPDMAAVHLEVLKRQDVLYAIQKIQQLSEDKEAEINMELADILELVNFRRRVTASNKDEAINAVKAHFSFYRCLPALLQYMDGLKINGVLNLVKKYPEARKFFSKSNHTTASEVMDLFTPSYSQNDDQKADEEIVMYNMHQFLKNVERGRITTQHMDLYDETEATVTVNMEQVLEAFTGCRHMVSKMMGTITFDHSCVALSTVNTCIPSIKFSNIKDIISYENMEAHMLNIIFGTLGFGIA